MSHQRDVSRRIAAELPVGTHEITNADIRARCGVSRVTQKLRASIALELEREGLQIVSDPAEAPLVVRKVARDRVAVQRPRVQPWWRRPWAVGIAAVLLLLVIAAAVSDPESPAPVADEPPVTEAADVEPVGSTTTTPVEPFTQAEQAVEDGDYAAAAALAARLGDDDRNRIRRKISRMLAREVRRALRRGDRQAARRAVRRAARFPSTAQMTSARGAYRRAQARAAARARAREAARRLAQRQAAERRAARRARRAAARARRDAEAAAAAEAERSYDAPDVSSGTPDVDTSGPSTTNWCGRRDGDGDGIYCE